MSMVPFLFGSPTRTLVGIYHPRLPAAPPRAAVVLCNPFGHEAIRAYRFGKVLAERLARNGCDVLRFDYYGTGDSGGTDDDADLAAWAGDLANARRELLRRSGLPTCRIVGIRLGGLVALSAAATQPGLADRVIAWDPVVDGAKYLAYLARRHRETLEIAFSVPVRGNAKSAAERLAESEREAIGFMTPAPFRQQIAAANFGDLARRAAGEVIAVYQPTGGEWGGYGGPDTTDANRVSWRALAHDTDWTTESAQNTALVPTKALMLLTELAGAP